MRWSFKLVTVAGIDIKVHATFALILFWVGYLQWRDGATLVAGAGAVVFVLALFLCVVLHELGHALTAKRYGVTTRDIILLPIGGVARLEKIPDQPKQELAIAAAGPAVNIVIAAVLIIGLVLTKSWTSVDDMARGGASFWQQLALVNIFLVVFNMLPAFPMDGGRILRALLALRLDYVKATRIAATLGQGLAFLLGLAGLFLNPFLVFIALFVWIGASHESNAVRLRQNLGGIPVAQVMLTDFDVLGAHDLLSRAVELTIAGSQQDFPVVDAAGRPLGLLTQSSLLAALSRNGATQPAAEVMDASFEVARPEELIGPVLERLHARGARTIPVVNDQRIAGLLTLENIGEFLAIQSALRTGRAQRWV